MKIDLPEIPVLGVWRQWFAWHPVEVRTQGESKLVWMEWVERWQDEWASVYRFIGDENKYR